MWRVTINGQQKTDIKNQDLAKDLKIIFRYRVQSKTGKFPTIEPDTIATLIQIKKLVKIHRRQYAFYAVIIHPETGRPCLVPQHSYQTLIEKDGQLYRTIYFGELENDHNPDVHGLTKDME
jgi:hypothetical protein